MTGVGLVADHGDDHAAAVAQVGVVGGDPVVADVARLDRDQVGSGAAERQVLADRQHRACRASPGPSAYVPGQIEIVSPAAASRIASRIRRYPGSGSSRSACRRSTSTARCSPRPVRLPPRQAPPWRPQPPAPASQPSCSPLVERPRACASTPPYLRSQAGTFRSPGEVSERSKERDWKSRMGGNVHRGFKSRPLRLECVGPGDRAHTFRRCAIGRHEVAISNPDKVFFPEPGLTKGDLVDVLPRRSRRARCTTSAAGPST